MNLNFYRQFLIAGFFSVIVFNSYSQLIDPSLITFIGAEKAATNYIQDTIAISEIVANTNGTFNGGIIGTGFLVQGKSLNADGKMVLVGVTCNHIAVEANKTNTQLFFGLDTANGWRSFPLKVLHLDAPNDIAIFTVDAEKAGITDLDSFGIKNHVIDKTLFDDSSSLVLGRGLLILGYPLSLGIDIQGNHPVVRFGMVAQNGHPTTFLVDGVASHGNSGSPVWSLEVPRPKFLGMITKMQYDYIDEDQYGRKLGTNLEYNSGLSIAVKASVILDEINEVNSNILK